MSLFGSAPAKETTDRPWDKKPAPEPTTYGVRVWTTSDTESWDFESEKPIAVTFDAEWAHVLCDDELTRFNRAHVVAIEETKE